MGSQDSLLKEGEIFAQEITSTLRSVFGDYIAAYQAYLSSGSRQFVQIRQLIPAGRDQKDSAAAPGIDLRINGKKALKVIVEYDCTWDRSEQFLAVERSTVNVYAHRVKEPIFRYDYLRHPEGGIPCAHMQIHGHRDATTFLMVAGGDHSTRGKRRLKTIHGKRIPPRMAELHFPLGGHRFRPCLEDVVSMLIDEFGVDTQEGAQEVLDAGRLAWRTKQLSASVRDQPHVAAKTLQHMGYHITLPAQGHPELAAQRLVAY